MLNSEQTTMDMNTLFEGLNDSGTYSGSCIATFEDPAGKITGQAVVRVAPESRGEVEISVESFEAPPEYESSLVAFINGSPPRRKGKGVVITIPAATEDRRISSLVVETQSGTFTATSGLLATPVFWGFASDETVSVWLNDLMFRSLSKAVARYWLMPLRGPFAEYYERRFAPPHVLAMDGESYILFNVDGLPTGVQVFRKGNIPEHPTVTYDAIAFGEFVGPSDTPEEIWTALPKGLHEALGFSLGADVTSPWIDVRGEDGKLLRRLFHQVGRESAKEGFRAFAPINGFRPDSGVGEFLKMFFAASREKREALIAPLNLIRSGTPGSFTIEDSLTDLIKALDNLCAAHKLTTQDLFKTLENDNQLRVDSVLKKARDELLEIRAENASSGRQGQVDVLNIITSKLSSATTTSRDFGIAVKNLLMGLNLQDGEALDRCYLALGLANSSWASMLSAARGEVIHKGFIRIRDRRDLRRWFDFARHLHDLCKRIIFREVDYKGSYQASTNPWQGDYAVDRVTSTTSLKDMGFSDLPTKL